MFMMRIPALLSIFSSLVAAISISQPAANTHIAAGSHTTVRWSHVNTDPKHMSLYLVNFVDWPPSYVPLAFNVDVAKNNARVQIPCHTRPSKGYQINAINGTNVYVIYAQSAKFNIKPPVHPKTCKDGPRPENPDCHHRTKRFAMDSPPHSNPNHPKYTSPGTVPKTIGWNGDYENPVTLPAVPTPTPGRQI